MKEYVTEIIKIDESLIEEGNIDSLKELPALQRAAELLKEGRSGGLSHRDGLWSGC